MKTAEPIQMPFGLMIRVDPRYHVLAEGPGHPRGRGFYLAEGRSGPL